MAEIQRSTHSGELTPLFLQFIRLQQHQALLALGRHPNPPPGAPPPNLQLARAYIDQLAMIRAKTSGNLTPDEEQSLGRVLGELQAAFLDVANAR